MDQSTTRLCQYGEVAVPQVLTWRAIRGLGEYVCDDARYGLGLRDEKAARLLKTALFMHGHVLAWLGVLRRIVRPKGRPPKTPTPGELFVPFYKLSASASATDRIILALADANRFDLLEEIGATITRSAYWKFGCEPCLEHTLGGLATHPRGSSEGLRVPGSQILLVAGVLCA